MRIGSEARWAAAEGLPFPLGATWIEEEQAFNFSLYSKHAESVELLLQWFFCFLQSRYFKDHNARKLRAERN